MEELELTEEQKTFLEECEEEFKDRYTEKDSEFMKMKNMNLKSPPIAEPWHSKDRSRPYERISQGMKRKFKH